jgi:hypothetical protein
VKPAQWALALLLSILPLVGCSYGTRFNVPSDEYATYRRVKLESALEARLRASLVYLHRYPKGTFAVEVRGAFEQAEERVRVRAWNSVPRLHAYLRAMPDSPHADLVRARIAHFKEVARVAAAEEVALLEKAAERQHLLDDADASRKGLQQELLQVIERLAQFDAYGQPLDQTSGSLHAWLMSVDSPGVCEQTTCVRTFRRDFAVPADLELAERTLSYDVRVEMQGGKVNKLVLSGFALLDRIAETIFVRRIDQGDLQAHAEGIGQSVHFISMGLHPALPDPPCAAEAISPIVLARRCQGKQATVTVGLDFTEADRIEFAPAPGSTPPAARP